MAGAEAAMTLEVGRWLQEQGATVGYEVHHAGDSNSYADLVALWPCGLLWGIEAKVSGWKKAVKQANRLSRSVDAAYILMPKIPMAQLQEYCAVWASEVGWLSYQPGTMPPFRVEKPARPKGACREHYRYYQPRGKVLVYDDTVESLQFSIRQGHTPLEYAIAKEAQG